MEDIGKIVGGVVVGEVLGGLTKSGGKVVDGENSAGTAGTTVVDQAATGIQWSKGIQRQGMPYEDFVASTLPADTRLPPNFKTFDFYDSVTQTATSVKTLDTTTAAKIADPTQVYSSLKSNVDATISFTNYTSGVKSVDSSQISSRVIDMAIPEGTTSAQWTQINRAIDYANSQGVTLKITVVKP